MSVIYVLWLREVKKYLRSRVQIVASLGSPLMYLGVLGFGLGPVFQRAGERKYLRTSRIHRAKTTRISVSSTSGRPRACDR